MTRDLFHRVRRGIPGAQLEAMEPPSACFASTEEIRQSQALAYRPGKLFLGVVDGTVREQRRQDGSLDRWVEGGPAIGIGDDRHIVTVAGSRAGKGRAVLIPNLLSYPGSVLVTDPKGELATLTARYRREKLGSAAYVLDPFNIVTGQAANYRVRFNPMAVLYPKSPSIVERAALIADALVKAGGSEPHWDESARTLIEGVILHVATCPLYEGRRNLVTVRELIARGAINVDSGEETPSIENLQGQMLGNDAAFGVIQDAAADFSEREERERNAVLSTTRRHLRFLALPEMRDVLSGNDFDLTALKTAATTIYLCLPARHMGTCSRWLRLFINLALQAMETTPGRPATGHSVLFGLDEFSILGYMKQLEDAAGQIAGFGVRLWPVLQDLGQLKALYKERWETFLGNAGVLQFFGNSDLTTLEWISKRLGKTSIRTLRGSEVSARDRDGTGLTGRSWSLETMDLLTVDEAAQIFGRDDPLLRQLIIWSGRDPMILQRAFYDRHALFTGKADE